jgi:hypothetical protein
MSIRQRYKKLILAALLSAGLVCIFLAIINLLPGHPSGRSEQEPTVPVRQELPTSNNVEESPTPVPEVRKEEAVPILVNIDQLVADYQENQLNADSKYEGKRLEVYGMVVRVTKGADGKPMLLLRNYADFDGVIAQLEDGQEANAATLRLGDIPHLVCLGGGKVMGRVVIGNCTIKSQPHRAASSKFGWSTDGLRQDVADALGTPDLATASPSVEKSVLLNANGQRQVVTASKACSNSDCSWDVLDTDSRRILISDSGSLHETSRITNGYYDVLVEGKETLTLYQFNGTKYQPIECYRKSEGQFGALAAQVNCVQ